MSLLIKMLTPVILINESEIIFMYSTRDNVVLRNYQTENVYESSLYKTIFLKYNH